MRRRLDAVLERVAEQVHPARVTVVDRIVFDVAVEVKIAAADADRVVADETPNGRVIVTSAEVHQPRLVIELAADKQETAFEIVSRFLSS